MFRMKALVATAVVLSMSFTAIDAGVLGVQAAAAQAQADGNCSAKGCDFGTGTGASSTGQSSTSASGGKHASGGSTTCTATDLTTNPPRQVTGPISSKPEFGPGGEWNYPDGPAPQPPGPNGETSGGKWYIIYCAGVPYDVEWIVDGTAPPGAAAVNPAVVANAALAHLPLHSPTINVNPDPAKSDALVGLPTWFWVNSEDVGTLPASASDGVVAVSGAVSADHITIDPGDGTGTFTCSGRGVEWQPGAAQTNCSHTYARSSAGSGASNSFVVTVTVSWSGTYTATVNGAPVPGGPLGPVQETSQRRIRVAEQQALNTPG